jgi:hypothetical protein
MNNFVEGLKNQISIVADGFYIFLHASSMSRKVLLKLLLASLKIISNSRHFIGSCIRIPPPPPTRLAATQRELGASIQPLQLPTINHPPEDHLV